MKPRIQQIIDQLMYNQVYAPNYPAEDRTNLEKEEVSIDEKLAQAITAVSKREDLGNWLRLGHQSITDAFENYRKGDESGACKCIESAIQYLRNAILRKPRKATFIAGQEGTATVAS